MPWREDVSSEKQYPPGDLAIWIFILAELLVFALFKGLLIGDYYMGLKGVRGLWRWVINIWLLVPGSMITWAFISAS